MLICSLDRRGPRLHRPLFPDLAARLTCAACTRRCAGFQGGRCAPAGALCAECGAVGEEARELGAYCGSRYVKETEPEKAAALADAIVAAVGADHADKLGESMN
jgi:hypothetical protein